MSSLIREMYRYVTLKLLFPWQYKRNCKKPLKEKKAIFLESQLPSKKKGTGSFISTV